LYANVPLRNYSCTRLSELAVITWNGHAVSEILITIVCYTICSSTAEIILSHLFLLLIELVLENNTLKYFVPVATVYIPTPSHSHYYHSCPHPIPAVLSTSASLPVCLYSIIIFVLPILIFRLFIVFFSITYFVFFSTFFSWDKGTVIKTWVLSYDALNVM